MTRSILTGLTLVLSFGLVAAAPASMSLPPQPKVHPAGIPANYVMVSPCVQQMGEHWANPKAPPDGTTLYGTNNGKPIFTEIMLTPKDFAAGKSYLDVLRPLPGYTIDHVDIEFESHGHPGMPYPHYDVHAYYISPAAVKDVCPNAPM